MNVLQLKGSYHQRPIDVYVYSPVQHTDVVTIVCKGLYSVFDPKHSSGVNILDEMLVDASLSHVMFYNSSRDYTFGADSNFESRQAAFSKDIFSWVRTQAGDKPEFWRKVWLSVLVWLLLIGWVLGEMFWF